MRSHSYVTQTKDMLDQYERNGMEMDSFCHLVYISHPIFEIRRSTNTNRALGYRFDNYIDYIQAIHPDYLMLFLQYAAAVYRIHEEYMSIYTVDEMTYSITVPLRNDNDGGNYWWVRQNCYAYSLNRQQRLISHLNVYRLFRRFESYETMRPTVIIKGEPRHEIEARVIRDVHTFFETSLFKDFNKSQQELYHYYWHRLRANQDHFPSAQEVASKMDIAPATISRYHQTMLRAHRELFPNFNCPDMETMMRFQVLLFQR